MLGQVHSALGSSIRVDGTSLIVTGAGESGWPLYGPYIELPAGAYSVGFRITADATDSASSPHEGCGFVDICQEDGRQILARREFSAVDLARTDGHLSLEFTTAEPGLFEFRVFAAGTVGLTIRQDRSLTMDAECFRAVVGGTSSSPAIVEPRITCGGFFLQNVALFRGLPGGGASLSPTAEGTVATLLGISMHVENTEDFQVIHEVIVHNDYNFIMKQPVCVVDIGMNVGIASLYFAKLPFVKEVHAFEPFPVPFNRALANLRLNQDLAGKIRLYNYALGGRTEEATVLYSESQTIGVSVRGAGHGAPLSISIRDAADALSDIIEQAKARGHAVVVKLDCEGSEFPIFETLARRGLLSEISVYLIEWHKWWSEKTTQWDLIEPLLAHDFIVLDQTDIANPHAGSLYAVRTRS